MALETLKGVTEIGGFKVLGHRYLKEDGNVDWLATDAARKLHPIYIDHEVNMISFRIQNGPIKENGGKPNGCQVDTLIHAAKEIIDELNKEYPSPYNDTAIKHLILALSQLEQRTKDREARGVEGTSNA